MKTDTPRSKRPHRPVLRTTIDAEVMERLRSLSEETGTPLGRLVDRALRPYLDTAEAPRARSEVAA